MKKSNIIKVAIIVISVILLLLLFITIYNVSIFDLMRS